MEERIHRALDGDLDPAQLTPDELLEYEALSEAIRGATGRYRTMAAPDLTSRVMAEVRNLDAPVPARKSLVGGLGLLDWLWRPRPIILAWRPVYAAMTLALVTGGLWAGLRPQGPAAVEFAPVAEAELAASPTIYVQFRLDAPGASTVQVVGSFTDWAEPVELVETVPGIWSTLLPLEPGVHDYTFIVDGDTWVVDPLAPTVDDGFGGSKNRLFLTRPLENA